MHVTKSSCNAGDESNGFAVVMLLLVSEHFNAQTVRQVFKQDNFIYSLLSLIQSYNRYSFLTSRKLERW